MASSIDLLEYHTYRVAPTWTWVSNSDMFKCLTQKEEEKEITGCIAKYIFNQKYLIAVQNVKEYYMLRFL